MTTLRFASWNLLTYGESEEVEQVRRRERAHQVLAGLDADVVAVQELIAEGDSAEKERVAGRRLRELAEAVGMECEIAPDRAAVGVGSRQHHVGLMWRPGIVPVGWQVSGLPMWHALAVVRLDVGGPVPIAHGSYHGPPFRRRARADEAEQVVAVMGRSEHAVGLVAGDWNSISADRTFIPGWVGEEAPWPDTWRLYDEDPYSRSWRGGVEWFREAVHQCVLRRDEDGRLDWAVDREPGEILAAGGLRDVAVELAAPWAATTGHWPADPHPPRRIDAVRVTAALVDALRSYTVAGGPEAGGGRAAPDPRTVSDHLPVVIEYDSDLVDAASDRAG